MKKIILAFLFINFNSFSVQYFTDSNYEFELARLASLETYQQETKKNTAESNFNVMNVCRQKGADCFFHALKNAIHIYYWKLGLIDEKTCVTNLNSKDPNIFPLEKWRAIVNNKFRMSDNLDDQAGEYLIKNVIGLSRKDYSIIPYLFEAKQQCIELDELLARTVQEFKSASKKTHMFILGSMGHLEVAGKIIGSTGHWVCIVAHKENGKITYFGADSLGSDLKNYFKELSNILEK